MDLDSTCESNGAFDPLPHKYQGRDIGAQGAGGYGSHRVRISHGLMLATKG